MIKEKITKKDRILMILLLGIIIVTIIDIPLTLAGIKKVGIEHEGNSLVKNFIKNEKAGSWMFIKVSTTVFLAFFTFMFIKTKKQNTIYNIVTYLLIFIFGFVVLYGGLVSWIWMNQIW